MQNARIEYIAGYDPSSRETFLKVLMQNDIFSPMRIFALKHASGTMGSMLAVQQELRKGNTQRELTVCTVLGEITLLAP